jgi:hypothetical protein
MDVAGASVAIGVCAHCGRIRVDLLLGPDADQDWAWIMPGVVAAIVFWRVGIGGMTTASQPRRSASWRSRSRCAGRHAKEPLLEHSTTEDIWPRQHGNAPAPGEHDPRRNAISCAVRKRARMPSARRGGASRKWTTSAAHKRRTNLATPRRECAAATAIRATNGRGPRRERDGRDGAQVVRTPATFNVARAAAAV